MNHFIAIGLPDNLRDQIAGLIPYNRPGVNWVAPENLHLTLFFCGRLDDVQYETVIQKVNEIKLLDAPFICPINGMDGFKDGNGDYRVVYLSVEKTDDLANLRSIISSAIDPIVPIDQTYGCYRPHITLGRPRDWGVKKCGEFIENHSDINLAPLPVDHIGFYQSVPGNGGHHYVERDRWSFGLD